MPVRQPAMGDGRHLAGVRGSGDSGHLAFNRLHRDILRDLADSTRYKWKTESMLRRRSYGGAMNGGSGAHRDSYWGGRVVREASMGRVTVGGDGWRERAWVNGI